MRREQERVTKKTRLRIVWTAATVLVVATAAVAGVSFRPSAPESGAADAPTRFLGTTTTTARAGTTTTTTAARGPLVQPAAAELPPLPAGGLGPGADSPDVRAYQQRLTNLRFDPGAVDGRYGQETAYAVEALQKLMGTTATGTIGEPERVALMTFRYADPLRADGEANRTEIDVTRQVITLYEQHQVRLITTTSTGSGENYCSNTPRDNPTRQVCEQANTPSGRFTFREYRDGWDRSPLGRLYNPFYFSGGIAVHGYPEVPTSPASHGCARIPMHVAEYFHTLVLVGDPVYVFGGVDAKILSSTPIDATTTTVPVPEPTPPFAPPLPPPVPESTTTTTTSTTPTTTTTTAAPPEPPVEG